MMDFDEYSKKNYHKRFLFEFRWVLDRNDIDAKKIVMEDLFIECNGFSTLSPDSRDELLELYLVRENLGGNIDSYVDIFGWNRIREGKILLDNIAEIYEKVNRGLRRAYSFYRDRFEKEAIVEYNEKLSKQKEIC